MVSGIMVILGALFAIFIEKKPVQQVIQETMQRSQQSGQQGDYTPPPEEEELSAFTRTVLAFTEDVWDRVYPELARQYTDQGAPARYEKPTLVLFSGMTQTACGQEQAGMGPFYCPGDNQVYIDLGFFDELEKKFDARGDFAQAYVIAPEVGHHVQNLLGISRQVQSQRNRISEAQYNRLSVRQELQADYLAGVWADHTQKEFKVLQRGDIDEGIRPAMTVGDDTIQRKATGRVVTEAFSHGSADQRIQWFTMGLKSGDPTANDPFQASFESLYSL